MLLLSISYLIMRPDSDIETCQNKQTPRETPLKGAVPMTTVRKILSFFMITLALLVLPAFVCVHAAAASDWPLEIVNESGVEITSLRISYTGAEKWSEGARHRPRFHTRHQRHKNNGGRPRDNLAAAPDTRNILHHRGRQARAALRTHQARRLIAAQSGAARRKD